MRHLLDARLHRCGRRYGVAWLILPVRLAVPAALLPMLVHLRGLALCQGPLEDKERRAADLGVEHGIARL